MLTDLFSITKLYNFVNTVPLKVSLMTVITQTYTMTPYVAQDTLKFN